METRHAESGGRPVLWVLGVLWLIAVSAGAPALRTEAAIAPGTLPTSFAGLDSIPADLLSIRWLDTLPDGEPVSLANGDTLRAETHWNRGGLTILADVSALDASAPSVPLVADAEADSVYRFEFTSEELTFDGSKTVPLTVTAPDLPGEQIFDDLRVCVSNLPPQLHSATFLPVRSHYRANDLLRIELLWSVSFGPGTVIADLREIEGSPDGWIEADSLGAQSGFEHFLLTYRIPVFPEERAGDYVIPLLCRNTRCGTTVDRSLQITLDPGRSTPPVLLDWEVLAPLDGNGEPRPLVNGDTIRLHTRWDRDGLVVAADAFELAPADTTRPVVLEVAPGEFEIIYTIPQDNTGRDSSDLPFRLIAEDLDGESTIDASVRFCLSNSHPRHLTTRLLSPREVYRGGDTLSVQSRWVSGSRLPLTLEMEVVRLEPGVNGPKHAVDPEVLGDSLYTFDLTYKIPPAREARGPDGVGIHLPITCRETGGCDVIRLGDLIQIDLDTTAPDTTGPVLDPLPAQTVEDSVLVSGTTVRNAARVALSRQNAFYSYTVVDSSNGRFSGWVRLIEDTENALRAWAEDELGNRTRSSEPELVRQVSAFLLDFDQPFLRGDELRLSDPGGIRDLRLGIYDLEGRTVREWRESGPFLDRSWSWDGTDAEGDPVRQGYYLIRAVWRRNDGRQKDETTGLVLGD